MSANDDIEALELAFWTGDATFYERHLADDAVMVFPLPTGILERSQIVAALGGTPRWSAVSLDGLEIRQPTKRTRCLTYTADATRAGRGETYKALVSSLYVEEAGEWKLSLHQHTPT